MIQSKTSGFVFTIVFVFLFKPLFSQDPKPPEAITDYAETLFGGSVAVNVLLNDFAEDGHPLEIVFCGSGGTIPFYGKAYCEDSLLFYQPSNNRKDKGDFPWTDTLEYRVQDLVNMLFSDIGFCIITINEPSFDGARESLAVNNIEVSFTAYGNYFRDYFGNYHPKFVVPTGSQKTTVRDSYLVMGAERVGKPAVATTHNNHSEYGYISDFWQGPVTDPYFFTVADDQPWDMVWKLSREDIEEHLQNFQEPGYEVPGVFQSWPAHGDTARNQAALLAAFNDWGNNGLYEPESGDYPWIPGDMAVFSIYNDMRLRNNASDGYQLGVEVHQTAYVYDCPEDSALFHTVFVHYRIINRWVWTYNEFYVGIITEFGIGSHHDDYFGCDTVLDAYFAYNDSIDDAFYEMPVYGTSPPAQAVVFLNHPLRSFVRHDNPNYWYVMNNLKGLWSNGLPIFYGGTGATGTDTTLFLYSGDPSNPEQWSEIVSNPGLSGFKKGHGAAGPFTFYPGDTIELDIAYVFARDYGGTNLSSVALLKDRIAQIRWYYENDTLPCGKFWSMIPRIKKEQQTVTMFPNPARDHLRMEWDDSREARMDIRDGTGRIRICQKLLNGERLDISSLEPGIYIVSITLETGTVHKKLIVQ